MIKVDALISVLISPIVIDRCLQCLWQQILWRYFSRLIGIRIHVLKVTGTGTHRDQQNKYCNEIFYRNFHDACSLKFNIYTKADASGTRQLAAVESHISAAYLGVYVTGILMEYGEVSPDRREAYRLQEVLFKPPRR